MQLVGSRGQLVRDFLYDASSTITTGGTPQIVLPEHASRTHLFIQNISTGNLFVEFGGARAHATLTSGVVTSITMDNVGFGYTLAPEVIFLGGGDLKKNPTYLCPGLAGNVSPSLPAAGTAVLSSGTVASVTITNGGANYVKAPYVFLRSRLEDPYGTAIASATNGVELASGGGSIFYNGTATPTDAISIFGATTGQQFTCKYMIGG